MRIYAFAICIILSNLIAFSSIPKAEAAVWQTTQQWSPAWEQQYRQWVAQNWNKDAFTVPGPYKGMLLDCADVVYSMRVIFASLNGLPFVMKDPSVRVGPHITNEMTRWDSKSQDERLRAFMALIHLLGSTASLPADSYPVAISPATLGSGDFILTDRSKHHSWTIKSFSRTGIPSLLYGSRPARSLFYERFEYPSVEFIFPLGIRAETNAGFRAFRQPADIGKPVHEVPGYSLEQYTFPPNAWSRTIQKRMQEFEETNDQRGSRLLEQACKGAKERADSVTQALKFHSGIGARCMNATEYDDHSTPSRDSRLKASLEELALAYKEGAGKMSNVLRKQLESVLSGEASVQNVNATCRFAISANASLTLGQVYAFAMADKLSNNPHDTLEMRWGLARGPSAKAQSCPVY